MNKITIVVYTSILFFLFFSGVIWGQIESDKVMPILADIYNMKYNLHVQEKVDTIDAKSGKMQIRSHATPRSAKIYGIDINQKDPIISATISYQGNISKIKGVSFTNLDSKTASAHFRLSVLPDLIKLTQIKYIGITPIMHYDHDLNMREPGKK